MGTGARLITRLSEETAQKQEHPGAKNLDVDDPERQPDIERPSFYLSMASLITNRPNLIKNGKATGRLRPAQERAARLPHEGKPLLLPDGLNVPFSVNPTVQHAQHFLSRPSPMCPHIGGRTLV
jgi:hypothetical protein